MSVPGTGDVLLFAYGSNLDPDQKEERTGAIREARRARLPGYRFAFNKWASNSGVYANIIVCPEDEVWGIVYRCSLQAITKMDQCEGVAGGHYHRLPICVLLDDGTSCSAETYVGGAQFICPEGSPTVEYLQTILRGARYHRLPDAYVRRIERLGAGPSRAV